MFVLNLPSFLVIKRNLRGSVFEKSERYEERFVISFFIYILLYGVHVSEPSVIFY